ncbi:unnamed protein product [Brassica rapa subsp. narinosa]
MRVGVVDALPPPPIIPPIVEPVRVKTEVVEKKNPRVPMARLGFRLKGQKIPLLTNHFKVNVANLHEYFHQYSVRGDGNKSTDESLDVEDDKTTDEEGGEKGPMQADNAEREYEFSPVKVLKITEYGGEVGELEQMKFFLEKLTCLELVKVSVYAITDKENARITSDLLMLPISSMCKLHIKFCEKARPKLNTERRLSS